MRVKNDCITAVQTVVVENTTLNSCLYDAVKKATSAEITLKQFSQLVNAVAPFND